MTSPNPATPSPRILVVDDERRNRQLLEVLLAAEGYDVLSAEHGGQGLVMAAEHAPDLILLDVMMPGMDGYQVTATLKRDARTRHIPVILLSALDDRNSRAHGLSAGAADFLTKPVNRAELCERVKHWLQPPEQGEDELTRASNAR
jgi:CheY-like chemotaxis protein